MSKKLVLKKKVSPPDAVDQVINAALSRVDNTIKELDKLRVRFQTAATPPDGTPALVKP